MTSIGPQSSTPENFIEEAFRASNNGKKRVVVNEQGADNPDNITWKVETNWEAFKRKVSFAPVTKQQNGRFVAVLKN